MSKIKDNLNMITYIGIHLSKDNLVIHIFGIALSLISSSHPKKGITIHISHYLKYEAGMNKLNKSHVFLLKMSLWTFFMVQTSFLNICCCVDVRYETLEDIHPKWPKALYHSGKFSLILFHFLSSLSTCQMSRTSKNRFFFCI